MLTSNDKLLTEMHIQQWDVFNIDLRSSPVAYVTKRLSTLFAGKAARKQLPCKETYERLKNERKRYVCCLITNLTGYILYIIKPLIGPFESW